MESYCTGNNFAWLISNMASSKYKFTYLTGLARKFRYHFQLGLEFAERQWGRLLTDVYTNWRIEPKYNSNSKNVSSIFWYSMYSSHAYFLVSSNFALFFHKYLANPDFNVPLKLKW